MKVVVSGSREWGDVKTVELAFKRFIRTENTQDVIIIHGGCKGLDLIAGSVAKGMNYNVVIFPADWNLYGKAAGPIRNRKMLDENPDLIIWFHQDIENSKGTKDLIKEANKRNLKVVCGHE